MTLKDIFVLGSFKSDKMPPEIQTSGVLVLQTLVRKFFREACKQRGEGGGRATRVLQGLSGLFEQALH